MVSSNGSCARYMFIIPYFLIVLTSLWLLSLTRTATTTTRKSHKVLFLGDSWAERANATTFQLHCDNSNVVNFGIGGTTALEWKNNDDGMLDNALKDNEDAYSVWISLGGNDLLRSTCTKDPVAIVNDIKAVIHQVVRHMPKAQILLFPYGRNPCDPFRGCYFTSMIEFASHLKEIPSSMKLSNTVTYVDTLNLTGGIEAYWDEDCIHLNSLGYDLLWRNDQIHQVMCPPPSWSNPTGTQPASGSTPTGNSTPTTVDTTSGGSSYFSVSSIRVVSVVMYWMMTKTV